MKLLYSAFFISLLCSPSLFAQDGDPKWYEVVNKSRANLLFECTAKLSEVDPVPGEPIEGRFDGRKGKYGIYAVLTPYQTKGGTRAHKLTCHYTVYYERLEYLRTPKKECSDLDDVLGPRWIENGDPDDVCEIAMSKKGTGVYSGVSRNLEKVINKTWPVPSSQYQDLKRQGKHSNVAEYFDGFCYEEYKKRADKGDEMFEDPYVIEGGPETSSCLRPFMPNADGDKR